MCVVVVVVNILRLIGKEFFMVSVASGKDEILAKQIEVKATGASDVKIYANGANQKAGGVDVTDNSSGKTKANKCGCIFPFNPPKKESPYGKFDINGNGKLDTEELAAMKAYIEALTKQKVKKPDKSEKVDKTDKIDKSDKQNNDFILILLLMLITQMLQQNNKDLIGKNEKEGKKPFFEVA